ncbi:hypothetical protein HKBW3S42_00489 [Candidatus Hakubella thermalkaliphila]|uniref:SpoVT-AbrB domain-containing protein n=1 Tax=Candidatus Hakubella thermalkaliphila TaxID=2754717 RepID=A0A6V8PKD4_9ACTN|nr:hypothetical protein HKBW3S42_00489 [Candidatus Hakubella thermalkaliphila]
MKTVKVRKIGNSYGITLPKEVVERYHLLEGKTVQIIEGQDGFTVTPYDPEFLAWARAYERTNTKYRDTLKALAE